MTADAPGGGDPERRAADRHPVVALVWYCLLGPDSGQSGPYLDGLAKSTDVSVTGIGFYSTTPLPEGERIFIEITIRRVSISCVGRIVHCRESQGGRYRIGIHFLVIPPNDRFLLRAHFGRK
jgi:hypothetical protein